METWVRTFENYFVILSPPLTFFSPLSLSWVLGSAAFLLSMVGESQAGAEGQFRGTYFLPCVSVPLVQKHNTRPRCTALPCAQLSQGGERFRGEIKWRTFSAAADFAECTELLFSRFTSKNDISRILFPHTIIPMLCIFLVSNKLLITLLCDVFWTYYTFNTYQGIPFHSK